MPDFKTLYDQHYGNLVRYAESHYKLRDDDAEQAVIDAFMDLYAALDAGREIQSPIAILYYQLRLHVIDIRRAARALQKLRQINIGDIKFEACLCDAIDARDAVATVWPQLKPAQRQLADYIYFLGYTQREAAEKMNLSLNTLEKRLITLRKKLRALLTKAIA